MSNRLSATGITEILTALAKTGAEDPRPLTYKTLVAQLGEQGLGIIAILFALPSALPISAIPGFSFIFGLPIVLVAIHLIIGRHEFWLPKKLASKTIDKEKFMRIIKKTLPYLRYVERLSKPRWGFFSSPMMERAHGLLLLLLSLLLLLPIPFSNFIFAALIICLGFGIAEKDGVFLGLGYLGGILYMALLLTVFRKVFLSFIS